MLLYFSGTGNSLYIAKGLSEALGDPLMAIPTLMQDPAKQLEWQQQLAENKHKRLGIVFPVYAWAPPQLVSEWLNRLQLPPDTYVYAVALCGENVGNTFEVLERRLKRAGGRLSAAYSVVSPNNYIVVGQVDVDSQARVAALLSQMSTAIGEIAQTVRERKEREWQVVKGPVPLLTTGLINPLFNRFGRSDKAYYAASHCTHCGLCQRVCPVANIQLEGKEAMPQWQGHCAMCTACLHTCPVQAIQYGKATVGKGRYFNPEVSVKALLLR